MPFLIAYIFSIPFILGSMKIDADRILDKKYEKAFGFGEYIVILGLWTFIGIVVKNHELMQYVREMLLFVYVPFVVAFFLLINMLPRRPQEHWRGHKNFLGFPPVGLIVLGGSLILAIGLLIFGTYKSMPVVLNHHKEFFEKLENSTQREKDIFNETDKPAFWIGLDDERIDTINNNPMYVSLALPWRMEVTIGLKADQSSKHLVLTYVKDGRGWILNRIENRDEKAKSWFSYR